MNTYIINAINILRSDDQTYASKEVAKAILLNCGFRSEDVDEIINASDDALQNFLEATVFYAWWPISFQFKVQNTKNACLYWIV